MRTSTLFLAPLLAAGCVLTSPGVAVQNRESSFQLPQLARARVAVWPVAAAKIDPAAAEGVTERYGSEAAFLDSLGRTVSARLVRSGGPRSLGSDQVVTQLGSAEATRPLLDSRRLLGTAGGSRFERAPAAELAKLGSLPALEGVRYAVLLPELSVELQSAVRGSGVHGTMSVSTMKWARGRVHLAVVDLGRGIVVWEGDMAASGLLSGSGMKQVEDGIGTAMDEALGLRPAPQELPSCTSQADCARGVCISGACR